MWEVEYTDQFDDWYQTLTEGEQDAVVARVELLESGGQPRAARLSTTFISHATRT